MQPKFTQKKFGLSIGLTPMIFAFLCLFTVSANAQQYVNGVLSTGATSISGVAAPAGKTWSECQNPTGNTTVANTSAGSGAQIAANNAVADDFTVTGAPWNLTKITVYAYSTGAADGPSPFNDLRLQIHNSSPLAGPTTVVFGDLTTNRLSASSNTNVFRIFNTVVTPATAPGTTRIIWKLEANVAVTLNPGTYWLEYQTGTALASNFTPNSSPIGVRTLPGYNAIQRIGTAWAALVDAGQGIPSDVAVDMPFIIDYNTGACSGTPAPGNTITSAAAVCPGINFTLSLQNATPGSGVTYKWQTSPTLTGTYTDIPGATSATYTGTLTASAFFRAQVTCGGNTGTSTPQEVTLNTPANCYCAAGATSTAFEKISKVDFATISNASTSTAGYENFTALAAPTVIKGQTLPITVALSGGFSTDEVRVWIDFNQDGDFTDAGEAVYVSNPGVGPHTGTITIAAGALTGNTRMRIRMQDSDPLFGAPNNATPCGNSGFGQVEDYTINIQPCVQGAITTNPVNRSIQCSAGTTFTTVASGSALSFQWQYRVSATGPWLNVPNAAPYSTSSSVSGTTTTGTLTLANIPASMSGYEYRSLVTGPCTATIFSTPGVLTITPLIATVTPTIDTVCLGGIAKISLTNASSPVTAVFTPASGLPLVVTDANTTGVSSTAVASGIPGNAVVSDVSITFTMPHTWVGDLVMNLTAPNGQTINLVAALDGGTGSNSTDNFTNTVISSSNTTTALSGAPAPRTGTFKADLFTATIPTIAPTTGNTWAPLLTTLNGNWRISMCDIGTGDVGTLTSWSIAITYGAPSTGIWTANPATPNTMFTDAAATVPYVPGAQAGEIWVKPTVNTSYSVVYSTPAPSSCTSGPTTVPITVITPGSAPTITPTTRVACVGGSTTFVAAATGGPFNYQWEVSTTNGASWAPIAGATTATLSLTNLTALMNNNQYRAVLTARRCTGSVVTTPAAVLTVNPIPVITLSSPSTQLVPGGNTTITASSTTPGLVYTWRRNGVATGVTGPTQYVTIDSIGVYSATGVLTGFSGCTGVSSNLVIGTQASDRLWIYPNPTDGKFEVRLYHPTDVATRREVQIFNSTGMMVAKKSYDYVRGMSPYYRMDFDLSHLAPGTYLVKVTEKNTSRIVSGLMIIQ